MNIAIAINCSENFRLFLHRSLHNRSCSKGKLKYAQENVQVKELKRDQEKSHCVLLVRHEYNKFNCSFIPSTSST